MRIPFLKENKEEAFKKLFETYYAPFCLYAKQFVEDKDICEDLVSDVFASLWEHIDSFDIESEYVLGYIKICVKNSCLNYLKHQKYEWEYVEQLKAKSFIYETMPDCVYTLNELYRMLYEALKKLPKTHRHVFMKNFFQGKSQNEIAEELDISVRSVNRYKQKIIELLYKELKDYLPLIWLLFALHSIYVNLG